MSVKSLVAIVCVSALAGCMSFAPIVEEPLRVGNVADLAPDELGFQPGVTTLEAARAQLRQRGVTGIREDAFAHMSRESNAVLGADYQTRLHLFTNDRYARSLTLPTRGLPPYGIALRFGMSGEERLLLVLYRDPLVRASEPPTLLSYEMTDDSVELRERVTLGKLTKKHGGMTQPMLFGSDLREGVMLVARDGDGVIWDNGYLVKIKGERVTLQAQAMIDAMKCACVRRYAAGQPNL